MEKDILNKRMKNYAYLQSSLESYPTSKLVNVTSIEFPGGNWISQADSLFFGYSSGYPGEVIIPLGAVNFVIGAVNE